jgi:hypothetical protein
VVQKTEGKLGKENKGEQEFLPVIVFEVAKLPREVHCSLHKRPLLIAVLSYEDPVDIILPFTHGPL